MNESPPERLVERVRAEFLEMPALRLKLEQMQRLCGIERSVCQMLLDSLVDAKFLCVSPDGHYARLTDGEISVHAGRRQTSDPNDGF